MKLPEGHREHVIRPDVGLTLDDGRVVFRPSGGRERHREPRVGIMLHFDESASDESGLAWFTDPRAWNVGYHFYVFDDGTYVTLGNSVAQTVEDLYRMRVYHAGVCRPSPRFADAPYEDANSAFLSIATAARTGDDQDPIVELTVARIARWIFDRERWFAPAETWRITGHEDEAWKRGRKKDPTGERPDGRPQVPPVLDKAAVRHLTGKLAA